MFWPFIKSAPAVTKSSPTNKQVTYTSDGLRALTKDEVAKLFHHHYRQLTTFNGLMDVSKFVREASYDEGTSNYKKIKDALADPQIRQKYSDIEKYIKEGNVNVKKLCEIANIIKNDFQLNEIEISIRSIPLNLDDETNSILIGGIELMKDVYNTKDY